MSKKNFLIQAKSVFEFIILAAAFIIPLGIYQLPISFANSALSSHLFKMNPLIDTALAILTVALAILVLAVLIRKSRLSFKELMFDNKKVSIKALLIDTLLAIILILITIVIGSILKQSTTNEDALTSLQREMPYSLFVMSVVCAPILEEYLFRYAVFANTRYILFQHINISERTLKIAQILLSGLLFGLFHMVSQPLSWYWLPQLLFFYALPGFIFAIRYLKTNALYDTIFAHVVLNLLLTLYTLLI